MHVWQVYRDVMSCSSIELDVIPAARFSEEGRVICSPLQTASRHPTTTTRDYPTLSLPAARAVSPRSRQCHIPTVVWAAVEGCLGSVYCLGAGRGLLSVHQDAYAHQPMPMFVRKGQY